MKKEKMIYDADEKCNFSTNCPKFVVNEQTHVVSLIDIQGNRANMSIKHFNKFVRAVKSG